MSTQVVENRVVEMEFDNSKFEKNVKTSQDSLKKLKESMDFSDSAKSIDEVSQHAAKVDFNPMNKGIESVKVAFNMLDVMAFNVMNRISNKIIDTSERMVRAFTIDQVNDGFSKYEMKMGSVQTIMAGTGESIDVVNAALAQLNDYSDKTIYSFADMTSNIGKFTNAGLKLDVAVDAIKGVSNVAAISGADATEASRAMYNFSQALSAGYVKLMDWKSIENANMATMGFKNQLIETAKALKVLNSEGADAKGNVVTAQNFNETLSDAWLTTDVLITTLKNYTYATNDMNDAEKELIRTELRSKGFMDDQIDEIFRLGNEATDSATKVKTFSQMMSVLKESVSTGWTKSFELVIGDFEQAKELFSGLTDTFGSIFSSQAKARNDLLADALSTQYVKSEDWRQITKETGREAGKFQEAIIETAKEYGVSVDEIIKTNGGFTNSLKQKWLTPEIFTKALDKMTKGVLEVGDAGTTASYDLQKLWDTAKVAARSGYGDGEERRKQLEEMGYEYQVVQDIVNEICGLDADRIHSMEESLTIQKLQKQTVKEIGTEEKKNSIFAKENNETIAQLVERLERKTGRELLMEGLKNMLETIIGLCGVLHDAWRDIFPATTGEQLYRLIARFHDFTESIKLNEEVSEKLRRVFKGLFAVLDVIWTIMSGITGAIWTGIKAAFKALGMDVLDVAAYIGDLAVSFRDWFKEHNFITNAIQNLVQWVYEGIVAVKDWIKAFIEIPAVQEAWSAVKTFFVNVYHEVDEWLGKAIDSVWGFIQSIFEFYDIDFTQIGVNIANWAKGVISWFQNLDFSWEALVEWFKKLKDNVVGYLSTIDLSWAGVKKIFTDAWQAIHDALMDMGIDVDWFIEFVKDKLTTFGKWVGEFFNRYGGTMIALGILMAIIILGAKIIGIAESLISPLKAVNDLLYGATKVCKAASHALNAFAVAELSAAILMLAAAGMVVALIPKDRLLPAMIALAAMVGMTVGMVYVIQKISGSDQEAHKASNVIIKIAAALLVMAVAIKIINGIGLKGIGTALIAFAGAMVILVASTIALSKTGEKGIDKVSDIFFKFGLAMVMIAVAAKLLQNIDPKKLCYNILALLPVFGAMIAVAAVSALADKGSNDVGSVLTKFGLSLILIAIAMKLIGKMDEDTIAKGIIVIGALTFFMLELIAFSAYAGTNNVGATLLGFGITVGLLLGSIFLIGLLDTKMIVKGVAAIGALSVFMGALIACTKYAKQVPFATLLGMSIAIAILAGVALVLGLVNPKNMWNGVAAVSVLSIMMDGLMIASGFAKDVSKSTLITFGVLIALLAGALVAMSMMTDPVSLLASSAALSIVLLSLSASMLIIGKIGAQNPKKLIKTLAPMFLVIAGIAAVLAAMSLVPHPERSIAAAVGIGVVLLALAASIKLIGKTKVSKTVTRALLSMIPIILTAGLVLTALTTFGDASKAIAAAVAIGIVIATIAGSLVALGLVKSVSKTTRETLLLMAGVVAIVGGILTLLTTFGDATKAISAAAAIDIVLLGVLGLTATMALLPKSKDLPLTSLAAVLASIAIVAVIIGVLANNISDPDGAIKVADALSELLLTLGVVMDMCAIAGTFGSAAEIGADALLAFVAKFALLAAGIGALTEWIPGIQDFLTTGLSVLEQLSEGLGKIIGSFVGGIGEGLSESLVGIGENLSEFWEKASGFVEGIQGLDDAFITNLDRFVSSMGSLVGSEFVAGISDFFGLSGSLSDLAQELTDMIPKLKEFADACAEVSDTQLVDATSVAGLIAVLSAAANAVPAQGGFWQKLAGTKDLSNFAEQLADAAPNLVKFIKDTEGYSYKDVTGSTSVIKTLATAVDSLGATGGLLQDVLGEKNIAVFAERLADAAPNLTSYIQNTKDISEEDVLGSNAAITAIAGAVDSLGRTGGFLQDVLGEKNLAKFAEQLNTAAPDLIAYISKTAGITPKHVSGSSNAIKILADACNALESTGGIADFFTGSKDLGLFGGQLKMFGGYIKGYFDYIEGIDFDIIKTSATALTDLIDMAGHVEGALAVDMNMSGGLTDLGAGVASYYDSVKDVAAYKISASAQALGELATTLVEMTQSNFGGADKFSDALVNFAEADLKKFVSVFDDYNVEMSDIGKRLAESFRAGMDQVQKDDVVEDAVNSSIENTLNTAKSLSSNFGGLGTDIVSNFKDGVKGSLGGISESITSILGKTLYAIGLQKPSFSSAGRGIGTSFVNGVDVNREGIASKFRTAVQGCIAELVGFVKDFTTIGSNLAKGFAMGMRGQLLEVSKAAQDMAEAAKKSAMKALDEHSPSKVFRQIGLFAGEGFVGALTDYSSIAGKAAEDMAGTSVDSFRDSINTIMTMFDADADLSPTITPVLDLSNVQSGVGAMNSLFNSGYALRYSSAISSVGSYQNRGDSSELISEIRGLKDALQGTGGTTNIINGLSYNDDSMVTDAIETLVRAARLNRRS